VDAIGIQHAGQVGTGLDQPAELPEPGGADQRGEFADRALLTAERAAPKEVHGRPAVRDLAADLLAAPRRAGMDGVRAFAARVGAAPETAYAT
jgi:hypothetical protein